MENHQGEEVKFLKDSEIVDAIRDALDTWDIIKDGVVD